MRVFLAVNLPQGIKQELAQILDELRHNYQNLPLKWVEPENLHLTLHFLGDQDENLLERVGRIGERIAPEFNRTGLGLGEWGAFPDLKFPRVIYISLIDSWVLKELQSRLGRELLKAGFETDARPWQAHLTVARNKDQAQCPGLDLPLLPKLAWDMASFELMRSDLAPDGAKYTILKSFKLGA
jgi:2'-5' RNA ligase